jgi:hypothetical protein
VAETTVGTYDPPSEPTGASRPSLAHGARVGRYLILNVIGRGGMGVVYAAHDPQLDRQVALKLIRTADSVEEAERLVREAQALAKLTDPHVVAVYDAGEVDGQVFVAMQLVDGEDLAAALQKRRRSEDVAQILSWFRDAGRGLAAAHAARLVHRDFKPSNVLIDKRGRVAVTDFGIAREQGRSHDPERRALSSANRLLGTPAYMAPEQHAFDRATEASDQFAFCVSLWEALFDQHPFVADRAATSSVEVGIAIFEGKLLPPRKRGRVPRRVVDALERGLSRDPAARWPSMIALIGELEPARRWRVPPRAAMAVAGVAAVAVAAVLAWPWPWHSDGGGVAAVDCELDAQIAAAWPDATRARIADELARGAPGYGAQVAATLTGKLDEDVRALHAAAGAVCSVVPGAADTTIAARACLATHTAELDGFVSELARGIPAAADRAPTAERLLERIAACDVKNAAAPPLAPFAGSVTELARRTGHAIGRYANGASDDAERELAYVAGRAAALQLHELEARAVYLRGMLEAELDQPARADLERAVDLATTRRFDDIAATAWLELLMLVTPGELDVTAKAARTAVAHTSDNGLELAANLAEARAALAANNRLVYVEEACLGVSRATVGIDPWLVHLARLCMANLPDEPVKFRVAELEDDRAAMAAMYGSDHPLLADTWLGLGAIWAVDTDPAVAREGMRALEQARADYVKRYPGGHATIARVHDVLGTTALAGGHTAQAHDEFLAAAAAIADRQSAHVALAASIYHHLALTSPPDEALRAIHTAGELAPDDDNIVAANARIAADAGAWSEAFLVGSRAVAHAGQLDEVTRAEVDWALARAIIGVHGDLAEAHRLAHGATAVLTAHHDFAGAAAIDAWLAHPPK